MSRDGALQNLGAHRGEGGPRRHHHQPRHPLGRLRHRLRGDDAQPSSRPVGTRSTRPRASCTSTHRKVLVVTATRTQGSSPSRTYRPRYPSPPRRPRALRVAAATAQRRLPRARRRAGQGARGLPHHETSARTPRASRGRPRDQAPPPDPNSSPNVAPPSTRGTHRAGADASSRIGPGSSARRAWDGRGRARSRPSTMRQRRAARGPRHRRGASSSRGRARRLPRARTCDDRSLFEGTESRPDDTFQGRSSRVRGMALSRAAEARATASAGATDVESKLVTEGIDGRVPTRALGLHGHAAVGGAPPDGYKAA